ncbi:hypothetical protein, partial [Salinibacter ruber]|uniref:hypothetical protein n=1 Tax=Salinibacter ruber TaxID=146919 RepID=UPI00216A4E98
PIETEIALLLFLFGLARKNTHILHHSTSRSESTSSLRSGRFDGAQNDLPKVLRSRVQLAHSGLTQRWRRSEKPGIAPVVRQH